MIDFNFWKKNYMGHSSLLSLFINFHPYVFWGLINHFPFKIPALHSGLCHFLVVNSFLAGPQTALF